MSKMKNILVVITLACVTLFMTQCKKEIIEQPGGNLSGETIEVSLNADNGSSKAIFDGVDEKVVEWEIGDILYVVGETDGYLGYVSAQNAGVSAYFTGAITKGSTAQYFHYYYFGDKTVGDVETALNAGYYTYDISSQKGTLADIANDLLLMHGKSSETIASGQTDLKNITMKSMISIVKLQFGVATGSLGNKVMCTGGYSGVKFNVKTGSLNTDNTANYKRYKKSVYLNSVSSNVYYMVVLPGTQTLEFSQGLIGLSCQGPAGGFAANTMYDTKTVTLGDLPYLPAIFTVNIGADNEQGTEDDTQVKFSKGNLQYLASPETWRFADKQWQYLGTAGYTDNGTTYASGNATAQKDREKQTKWIDLFGWGTSGLTGSLTPHATCWQPWDATFIHASYLAYGYQSKNLYDDPGGCYPGRADWGSNTVYYGSISTTGWRTPTTGELTYLLNTRIVNSDTGEGKSYQRATINSDAKGGVYGLILYPDNYTSQTTATSYTSSQWVQMESDGAVFLPAAGKRGASIVVDGVNTNGRYWTSSTTTTDYIAYNLNFHSSNLNGGNPDGKANGYAVRLVRDVVDANANANPFGPETW